MTGFSNSVLGGASKLIRAAIASPNFVTGVTGWTVNKDGSAEFNNVTIRGATVLGSTSLTYNGAPAAGNLIASDSATAFVDSFGNNVVAGRASYQVTSSPFYATSLNGGIVTWYSGASNQGPWTAVANATPHAVSPSGIIITGNGELVLQNGSGTASISLGTLVSPNLTVIQGNVNNVDAGQLDSLGTVETWHAMPAFGAGFSHGTPAPVFKAYLDRTVAFAGEVNVTSGTTSGTVVTLPTSQYFPPSVKKWAVPISAGVPAGAANVQITLNASGQLILSAGPTGAAYSFALDMVRYPLDV